MIERVCDSVQEHLPSSRLVILADGGSSDLRYVEFKARVKDLGWELCEADRHLHQTLLLKYAFDFVKTPYVLVGEHDWPLKRQYVDWQGITNSLKDRSFSIVQLRQKAPAPWEQKFWGPMRGSYLPTKLFQTPWHIARCDRYRELLAGITAPDFLEGSIMDNALRSTGVINEMASYLPPGPSARMYHLDGNNVVSSAQCVGLEKQ